MRERHTAHGASTDLRNFDSVRNAVASLFGNGSSGETTAYIQRMKALSNPSAPSMEQSSDENFSAAERALLAMGATREPSPSLSAPQ